MIDKIILVFCFTMYGPHTSFISIPHSHLLNLSCYSLFSVNILGSEKKILYIFSKIWYYYTSVQLARPIMD